VHYGCPHFASLQNAPNLQHTALVSTRFARKWLTSCQPF
jgi:hypothetical protein